MSAHHPIEPRIEDWGRTEYSAALEMQLDCLQKRRQGLIPNTLALTEHHPVYTIGKRSGSRQHLIAKDEFLLKEDISVVETNRGGDITYHGPGQIVGYLFIDLSASRDLHALLRNVETLLIDSLRAFNLHTTRREGLTGVWIDQRKIAAIGMSARHWISFHGFALNVDPNLQHFQGIVPCGINDGTVTSMCQEMGSSCDIEAVKLTLISNFKKQIGLLNQ